MMPKTTIISATCKWHAQPRTQTIEVSTAALQDYMRGTFVQNAFPDLTPQQREIIVNQRVPGVYMCEECWRATDPDGEEG